MKNHFHIPSIMTMIIIIIISELLNFRRRKMKNHFYIPSSRSQRDDLPLWDLESLDNESGKTPVPANIFPQVPYDDDDFFYNGDDDLESLVGPLSQLCS